MCVTLTSSKPWTFNYPPQTETNINNFPSPSMSPCFVLGDMNHYKLELALPGFVQYMKCGTRNTIVLDKSFWIISGAQLALSQPVQIVLRFIVCTLINLCLIQVGLNINYVTMVGG